MAEKKPPPSSIWNSASIESISVAHFRTLTY